MNKNEFYAKPLKSKPQNKIYIIDKITNKSIIMKSCSSIIFLKDNEYIKFSD